MLLFCWCCGCKPFESSTEPLCATSKPLWHSEEKWEPSTTVPRSMQYKHITIHVSMKIKEAMRAHTHLTLQPSLGHWAPGNLCLFRAFQESRELSFSLEIHVQYYMQFSISLEFSMKAFLRFFYKLIKRSTGNKQLVAQILHWTASAMTFFRKICTNCLCFFNQK